MDSFRLYNVNKKFKKLTDEEIEHLLILSSNGDENAKKELFEGNFRLVANIIKNHYYSFDFDVQEELFQIGCLGLWKTIINFDMSYNNKFSTYAIPVIKGTMSTYLRDYTPVKISIEDKILSKKIDKLNQAYEKKHGRKMTVTELSMLLGTDESKIILAIQSSNKVISLSQSLNNSFEVGDLCLQDVIEDFIADTHNIDAKIDIFNAINKVLNSMSESYQKTIKFRYGFGWSVKSQQEIAEILGVSKSLVSRIVNIFKEKLEEELSCYDINTHKKKYNNDRENFFDLYTSNGYSIEQLFEAIDQLSDENKRIIELRFGLNGNEITPVKRLSEKLNMKCSLLSNRISCIKNYIFTKLKSPKKVFKKSQIR